VDRQGQQPSFLKPLGRGREKAAPAGTTRCIAKIHSGLTACMVNKR
jgi:hypothetical protein